MKRVFIGLSVITVLGILAVATLVWSGLSAPQGTADIALVLGNTVHSDGTPSPRLKARLDTAISQFTSGHFKLILVSGGTGKEGLPEGTAMKNYLVQNGIPERVIIVDDQGVNTDASAKNAKRILLSHNLKSVCVITQYFHVPRSRMALSKLGVSPVYSAHPDYFELRDIYSTLREIPAYLKYYFKKTEPE